MKKLILILFLFIAGIAKSQTWKADSLVYYSSAYNLNPDTLITEDITIVIERGTLTISKHNARFHATIEDTLPVARTNYGIVDRIFNVRTYPTMYQQDTGYTMMLIMSYFDEKLIALGLLHNEQLFIYHITNQILDGIARQRKYPYIRDWTRAALGQ